MKIEELNFKKIKLTNKRKEYVARHLFMARPKGLPIKQARQGFIKSLNDKGYVPININTIGKDRYGIVYAVCIYFGKKNASKIKELERPKNNTIKIVPMR